MNFVLTALENACIVVLSLVMITIIFFHGDHVIVRDSSIYIIHVPSLPEIFQFVLHPRK